MVGRTVGGMVRTQASSCRQSAVSALAWPENSIRARGVFQLFDGDQSVRKSVSRFLFEQFAYKFFQ